MPNFARIQIAFKNVYVRIATAMLLGLVVALAIYKAMCRRTPAR